MKQFLASLLVHIGMIILVLLGLTFVFGGTGVLMFFTVLAFRANVFLGLGISFLFICWVALLITIWENL